MYHLKSTWFLFQDYIIKQIYLGKVISEHVLQKQSGNYEVRDVNCNGAELVMNHLSYTPWMCFDLTQSSKCDFSDAYGKHFEGKCSRPVEWFWADTCWYAKNMYILHNVCKTILCSYLTWFISWTTQFLHVTEKSEAINSSLLKTFLWWKTYCLLQITNTGDFFYKC